MLRAAAALLAAGYLPPENQQPEIIRLRECEANVTGGVMPGTGQCTVGDELDHAHRHQNGHALRARQHSIAVVIAGLAYQPTSALPANAVDGSAFITHVLTPLTEAGHQLDLYICLGHTDARTPYARRMSNLTELRSPIVFSHDGTPWSRLERCFELAANDKERSHDLYLRTRPDLDWFATLQLPPARLLSSHVALRARLLLSPTAPTTQQLAWTCKNTWRPPVRGEAGASTCFLVDDQVAIIPHWAAEAYFRPLGKGCAVSKAARTTARCAVPYWSRPKELIITMRLAMCNVSALVWPFGAMLVQGKGSLALMSTTSTMTTARQVEAVQDTLRQNERCVGPTVR